MVIKMKAKIKAIMRSVLPAYRVALRLENKLTGAVGEFKRYPKPALTLEVQLAEHCNLGCAYCDHCSPIAEPEFLEPESFAGDMARLSELFGGEMQFIKLMGGEPLLHPEVTEFMRLARESFPVGHILLVTNGLLLPKQPETFWLACKKYDVWVTPTVYPCDIDYASGKELAKKYGVRYMNYDEYCGNDFPVKTMSKQLFDLDALQDPRRSFMMCASGNECLFLQRGRMYTCPVCPTSRHFSRQFGVNLHISDKDSIDIYEAKTGAEILQFLSKPIPFCRFCDKLNRVDGLQWKRTEKSVTEWTL